MATNHEKAISEYVSEVAKQLATGHAAEHAYRPALKTLMEALGEIDAVNDPKRSEHGAPDFVFLQRGARDLILGWAEAKDITGNLDKTEKTEQLQRYAGYSNLFLTNYLEFRFYSNGHRYATISLGEVKAGKISTRPENFQALADELRQFLGRAPSPITSGSRLAEVMGAKARRIRHNVHQYLSIQGEKKAELLSIFHLIRETLVHDIDKERFADMYAQTLVYGLFAARYNDKSSEDFSRAEARDLVPPSNPFLRQFFDHIAGANFDSRLAYIVDELCDVFRVSDVRGIVHKHLARPDDDRDPIIHFYEDFLKAYDPHERKRMGAYYTPLPVVRFMIEMVDTVLKEEFDLSKGIADTSKRKVKVTVQGKRVEHEFHTLQIIDPAVGTATFLNEIVKHIHSGFSGQEGRWPAYAKDDLIPRLHGFELMMAPYTVAHLKLGLTLKESGVDDFGKRLGVYLTNTLEEGMDRPQTLFQQPGLAGAVATEAIEAGEIKNERPIMVVIGNPPYSGISSNETDFANSLIDRYKVEPGGQVRLQERKHWLNDDYVKFIAFAEAMIDANGSGVVAMITNHGYLDNPTFRGMRWRLRESFDTIYALDLHGSTKKMETAEDGGKDENVFNIQQGVAILIGVKKSRKSTRLADVLAADLFGSRQHKFDVLDSGDVNFVAVESRDPMHYFKAKDLSGESDYLAGVGLDELFEARVAGIVTARDSVVTDIDATALIERIETLASFDLSDAEVRERLFPGKKDGKYLAGDSRGWKLELARDKVRAEDHEAMVKTLAYRPFDTRYIYYSPSMVDWPRTDLMHNFDEPNVGLVFNRTIEQKRDYTDIFVTEQMIQHHSLSLKEVNYVAPLKVRTELGEQVDNLRSGARQTLTAGLSGSPDAIEVLDYAYGRLHSPSYRSKYAQFLKSSFPRVPIPADDVEFDFFVGHGRRLRELHLMKSAESNELITTYGTSGNNLVEKPRFADGKVYINEHQSFDGVPQAAWDFFVGGYQPARKWLKDRQGRQLSSSDIEHYQRIINVLTKTEQIMRSIDDGQVT